MKDKIGEERFVPTHIVFGVILRFPVICTQFPVQKRRREVLAAAQDEVIAIIAGMKIVTF